MVPTVYGLSKYNLSPLNNQNFSHVYIHRLWRMETKWLMKGLPMSIPDLEEPWTIYLLEKSTKFNRGTNIDVSKFTPGLTIQKDFAILSA